MLTALKPGKRGRIAGRVSIVASEYNGRYVNAMLRHTKRELRAGGVTEIQVVRVPGAFEIPVVAAKLSSLTPKPAVVICLGVIFQGETAHAQQIGDAVSQSLSRLQTELLVPVIHGVYLFDNEDQARVRCLGKEHNRGIEAARTALAMSDVMASL